MLTVCHSGCSERAALEAWTVTRPDVSGSVVGYSQRQIIPVCEGTLAFKPCPDRFSLATLRKHAARIFRLESLQDILCSNGHRSGPCQVVARSSASQLHNGVFTFAPKSGFLQAARKNDQIKQSIAVPMSAALGHRTGIRWADQKPVCV